MKTNKIPLTNGYAGFLGIIGFFLNDPLQKTLCFACFAFFLFFLISSKLKETQDERMIKNYRKAQMLASNIVFSILVFTCIAMVFNILVISKLTITFALASVIVLTPLIIISAFYIYEKKS